MEILLCGHATLASSKIVFDTTALDHIKFINKQKTELLIAKVGNKISMEFPVYDTKEIEVPARMLAALAISEIEATRFNTENNIVLIEIKSATDLANLKPDFAELVRSYTGINGVLVTAISNTKNFDFHYRYFWPWAGTNEDPVTGGVQTFLTKYWAEKLNKTKLDAYQSSLRTGMMRTELAQNKVYILGEAVTVLEGHFIL